MIRVLIADDDEDMRSGVKNLLANQDDIAVVGEASNGAEAIERAGELQPDIVLMDIRMPGVDGVVATEQITSDRFARSAGKTIQVVVLTGYKIHENVYQAIVAGATGFLLKDMLRPNLVSALRAVAAGDGWLSPEVTAVLLKRFTSEQDRQGNNPDILRSLTPREREILVLIARGRSNLEICGDLYISEPTVKTHVGRIFAKLGLRDRAQAVIVAYETGLVRPRWAGP
jgi:DNA-binding NarL/FixJ family response regulator